MKKSIKIVSLFAITAAALLATQIVTTELPPMSGKDRIQAATALRDYAEHQRFWAYLMGMSGLDNQRLIGQAEGLEAAANYIIQFTPQP